MHGSGARSIWGASPDDVWIVGPSGLYQERLLHYDGQRWSTYTKEPIYCSAEVLFGFSRDDIWMGGTAGWGTHGAGIWHYDGERWSPYHVYDVKGSRIIEVDDIWGTSPDDVYASGLFSLADGPPNSFRGFVLHYDGKKWREVVRADFESQFIQIRKEGKRVYLLSYDNIRMVYEIYILEGKKLKRIYSNQRIVCMYHTTDDNRVYFFIDSYVCRYSNGRFVKLFPIRHERFDFGVCGRNNKDLFLTMDGGLGHYNGEDVVYLYRRAHTHFFTFQALLLEKDVFFLLRGWTDMSSLVLHGRLKE